METLKHECGVVLIRLLKPLSYYQEKYGSWTYGLQKLYLMMEKQHNRGQEGAGIGCVKLNVRPGEEYIFRERALGSGAITELFDTVAKEYNDLSPEQMNDAEFAKESIPFAGELYMGHLRYATTGKRGMAYVHPFLRRNNWCAKTLMVCGNFNLTNVEEVFENIISIGQHPRRYADTHLLVEQLGHKLDTQVEHLYKECVEDGFTGTDITNEIDKRMDTTKLLKKCAPIWDGGYVICGMTGSGEMFAIRDPWGVRSCFYYSDDEICILTSERPVIQTAMNVPIDTIHELQPGEALTITRRGEIKVSQILEKKKVFAPCSFERVYFSRGSDRDIYTERKMLGRLVVEQIMKAIDYDFKHSVFSFIPNTAEVAYFGMLQGLEDYLNIQKKKMILEKGSKITEQELWDILQLRVRTEKVAIKDIKLRTFIAEGKTRNDMAAHVYDVTYGTIEPGVDNLIVIDDSIVRGTTLKQSILKILDRLHPKKIVVVSSSPQVRYPDCYGIDMSSMDQFTAFKAAIALLKERGMTKVIDDAYKEAIKQRGTTKECEVNCAKAIYAQFTPDEITAEITKQLTPSDIGCKVEIVYQSLEGLHKACPNNGGDWYFSGDFPTPGGMRFVNEAFINWYEESYRK